MMKMSSAPPPLLLLVVLATVVTLAAATTEDTFNLKSLADICTTWTYQTNDHGTFHDSVGRADDHKTYDNDLDACVLVQPKVKSNGRVVMHFSRLSLEGYYDYVTVFDLHLLSSGASREQAILSAEADTETTFSSTEGFVLRFHTDESVTEQGYTCQYALDVHDAPVDPQEKYVLEKNQEANMEACATTMYPEDGVVYCREGKTATFTISPTTNAKCTEAKISMRGTAKSDRVRVGGRSALFDIGASFLDNGQFAFDFGLKTPIGPYTVVLKCNGGDIGDHLTLFVVKDPANPQSDVYMKDESDRAFYTEATAGCQFTGSQQCTAWEYGQYATSSMRAVGLIVEHMSYEQRSSTALVLRAISNIINDRVLQGRWSEPYADGTVPWGWTGSTAILAQYAQTNQIVKFGQCWVFSGVTTTVSRALGVPTRSVTNFQSAHEQRQHGEFDQDVAKHYKCSKGGESCPKVDVTGDSVWNFHVWNEAYMLDSRHASDGFGWNQFDATAQEISDDLYQMGPVPLARIRAGDYSAKWDAAFGAGEVNANETLYMLRYGKTKYEPMYTLTRSVGTYMATENPRRRRTVMNVVSGYKTETLRAKIYPSFMEMEVGSAERAAAAEQADWARFEEVWHKATQPLVSKCRIVKEDGKIYRVGDDVAVDCVLTSQMAKKITLDVNIFAHMESYKGAALQANPRTGLSAAKEESKRGRPNSIVPMPPVASYSKAVTFTGAGVTKRVAWKVPASKYARFLSEGSTMRVEFNAISSSHRDASFLREDTVTIAPPKLTLVIADFAQGTKGKAFVTITNPLSVPMTAVVVKVAVTNAGANVIAKRTVASIAPGKSVRVGVDIKSVNCKKVTVVATAESRELKGMAGQGDAVVTCKGKVIGSQCRKNGRQRIKCGPKIKVDKTAIKQKPLVKRRAKKKPAVTKAQAHKNRTTATKTNTNTKPKTKTASTSAAATKRGRRFPGKPNRKLTASKKPNNKKKAATVIKKQTMVKSTKKDSRIVKLKPVGALAMKKTTMAKVGKRTQKNKVAVKGSMPDVSDLESKLAAVKTL